MHTVCCDSIKMESGKDSNGLPFIASQVALVVKNPLANVGGMRRGFDPWVGKIPWRREWQPTPVFLPGESPWMEEPGGLQSIGLQRVRQDWSDLTHTHTQCEISQWVAVHTRNREDRKGLEQVSCLIQQISDLRKVRHLQANICFSIQAYSYLEIWCCGPVSP